MVSEKKSRHCRALLLPMRAAPDEIEHGVEEDDGRAADAVHESVAKLGGDEAQEDGGEADADVESAPKPMPSTAAEMSRPAVVPTWLKSSMPAAKQAKPG